MGSGSIGPGRGEYGSSGGGTGGGGGGDGQDVDRDGRVIKLKDTISNVILGTKPNSPLTYAPLLKIHHPIMSIIGGEIGWLER